MCAYVRTCVRACLCVCVSVCVCRWEQEENSLASDEARPGDVRPK